MLNELGPIPSCAQTGRSSAWNIVERYRTLLAIPVGLSVPVARIVSDEFAVPIAGTVELTVLAGLFLLALAALSWPWTSYPVALRLSLASTTALVCVGTVNAFVRDPGDTRIVPWIVPVGVVFVFAVFCAGAFVVLSGLVFVRTRYWPVYPPGHCERCGYNLFALPSARCPECGTPFVSKKPIGEGMYEQEHGARQHRLSQQPSRGERLV